MQLMQFPQGQSINERTIEITGKITEDKHIILSVKDNGPGIPDDQLENIFIPFYTTKEHGSGIGLSLARQIMKLHGGTITVFSKPDRRNRFLPDFSVTHLVLNPFMFQLVRTIKPEISQKKMLMRLKKENLL